MALGHDGTNGGAAGMKIDATNRVMHGSSGQSTGFRMTIAKEIDIGGNRFHNVSFAVIGTGPLADVDAGIIGMPVLLALGAIRWSPDGAVEIGSPSSRARGDANLVFDRNRLLLRTRVFGRDVLTTLDTGATTTDLNANFAETFPQAVQGALGREVCVAPDHLGKGESWPTSAPARSTHRLVDAAPSGDTAPGKPDPEVGIR
jgi:hypothetical protein